MFVDTMVTHKDYAILEARNKFLLASFLGHKFISILYCQVPPSKNKVDYYYYFALFLLSHNRFKTLKACTPSPPHPQI